MRQDGDGVPIRNRQQLGDALGHRIGHGGTGIARDDEEGVQLARAQARGRGRRAHMLDDEIVLEDAEVTQNQQGVDQRPRALAVQGHALAGKIGDRVDAGPAPGHDLHDPRVEAGDQPDVAQRFETLEDAGAVIGSEHDVGLTEARFDATGIDIPGIGDRALRGLGDADQAGHAAASSLVAGPGSRRARDDVGDDGRHRMEGAGRAAGADTEEVELLRGGGPWCQHDARNRGHQQAERAPSRQSRGPHRHLLRIPCSAATPSSPTGHAAIMAHHVKSVPAREGAMPGFRSFPSRVARLSGRRWAIVRATASVTGAPLFRARSLLWWPDRDVEDGPSPCEPSF